MHVQVNGCMDVWMDVYIQGSNSSNHFPISAKHSHLNSQTTSASLCNPQWVLGLTVFGSLMPFACQGQVELYRPAESSEPAEVEAGVSLPQSLRGMF